MTGEARVNPVLLSREGEERYTFGVVRVRFVKKMSRDELDAFALRNDVVLLEHTAPTRRVTVRSITPEDVYLPELTAHLSKQPEVRVASEDALVHVGRHKMPTTSVG